MISVIVVRVVIVLVLVMIITLIIRQSIALKNERRIRRYTIDSIREESDSLFDMIISKYYGFVVRTRKKISKYKFIKDISKRYQKYILIGDKDNTVDFIINKVVIGLIFLCLVIISYGVQGKVLGILGIIFFFVVGYYLYDIFLIVRSRRRIKKIQSDMLRAIMIMNSAFKSGKSTLQAVYIASRELPYPINLEFKKIYQDMKYGLDTLVVFERFSKRIDIEETRYLSTSLTILNKTGGNIVAVFNSIEKTLFDKKKLEEELKNLTAASNLVVKLLLFIPFVFIFIIYLLNPNYFSPLFSSPLGYMVIIFCILLLVVYVWLLQKILKVRF